MKIRSEYLIKLAYKYSTRFKTKSTNFDSNYIIEWKISTIIHSFWQQLDAKKSLQFFLLRIIWNVKQFWRNWIDESTTIRLGSSIIDLEVWEVSSTKRLYILIFIFFPNDCFSTVHLFVFFFLLMQKKGYLFFIQVILVSMYTSFAYPFLTKS